MAAIHGAAGEWARVRGTVRGLWPLFVGFFLAGFSVALMLVLTNPLIGAGLFILSLCESVFSLRIGLRHIERYFKGARGEEKVASILQELPDDYHVFNDFLAKKCQIDHVVVGPAGVFAIETKCWSGVVTIEDGGVYVSGKLPDRSPILQVEREAALLKAELAKRGWQGEVTPILVFASNTFDARIAEFGGTVVMNANFLRESFKTNKVALPRPELARLIKLMEMAD